MLAMSDSTTPVQVNMHEAKSQLSRLGKMAWAGKQVVIAKAGEPYLDLVPHREQPVRRRRGCLAGQIWIAEDFDETGDDIIAAFEGDA
jgi:antitoxin (DNA-binding transcriptional repressor) of toxin-antitoxin stability system